MENTSKISNMYYSNPWFSTRYHFRTSQISFPCRPLCDCHNPWTSVIRSLSSTLRYPGIQTGPDGRYFQMKSKFVDRPLSLMLSCVYRMEKGRCLFVEVPSADKRVDWAKVSRLSQKCDFLLTVEFELFGFEFGSDSRVSEKV